MQRKINSIGSRSIGRPHWKLAASVGLVALVTLLSFLSALDNGFVNWDDDLYVTQNILIRDLSWNNIKTIFLSPVATMYVPLVPLSFSLEYALWGLDPFGYHLTNVLLHVGNSLLVFALVLRLSGQLLPALVASLLFGVHPLHVESVAWVTERKDVLSALFFLGALLFYLRYQEDGRNRFYVLSLGSFVLSLLTKAMGVTFPIVLFLCDYLSDRSFTKRSVVEKVPFLMVSALFSLVALLGHHPVGDPHVPRLYALTENVLIACWGMVFYLGKTLLPIQLSAFYPYPAEISLRLPSFYLPLILLLALAAGVWFSRRYTRKVVFGSLFFAFTLLPVLNIIPFSGAAAGDRFIYIPAIGLFYLAGVAFQKIYSWKIRRERAKKLVLTVLLAVTVSTLGTLTWQRCNVWQDSETLWSSVLELYPGVPHAHTNLGNAYSEKGRLDEAIGQYKMAIALNPNHSAAHNNLGTAYVKKGRMDEAIAEYKKAIALDPADTRLYNHLGVAYTSKGMLDAAIAEYKKVVDLNPSNALGHNNLGIAYVKKGMLDAAIAEYKKAIVFNPSGALSYYNLGLVYEGKGELDNAVAEYKKAIALNLAGHLAHYNLGNVYVRKKELDAAIAEYKKAVAISPNSDSTHYNLAQTWQMKGNLKQAIFHYRRAVALNPDRKLFHYKLASLPHR